MSSSYQLESTPIWNDIKPIIFNDNPILTFNLKGQLHTEKEDISVLRIKSLDTIRDYVNSISDRMHIEFLMPLGDYIRRLYPYRAHLEFSIKRTTMVKDTSDSPDIKSSIERYKAVFLTKDNPGASGYELDVFDSSALDNAQLVTVKLQLLNRSLEPLRIKTVSKIFRNVTQEQVIHSLLGGESLRILVDGRPAIDGIDIVKPDNKQLNKHVVVPSGTTIATVPTYLQEEMLGVYNGGIGTYLQTYKDKKLWFVYPLYNYRRFDTAKTKVVFYLIPKTKYPNVEKTFIQVGSVIKILINNDVKYTDSADVDYMNNGVGFKNAHASSFMSKPVKITDKGPVLSRTNINNEVIGKDRKDGLNYAKLSDNPITDNPFIEYSKINSRNVSRVSIEWEHADISLIYPGMPCKFTYYGNSKINELTGIIAFIHSYDRLLGTGVNSKQYRNATHITLLLNKKEVTPDLPTNKPYGDF